MDNIKKLCDSIVNATEGIKEVIEEIEEKHKIRHKSYQYIRVASKTIRDNSQVIRKEILKKFKEQQEKK